MDPLSDELKKAVNVAQAFLSLTLAKEKLSPEAEKERKLLADWLKKLKTKIGEPPADVDPAQNLPPSRPPKGSGPINAKEKLEDKDEIYDDVTGTDDENEGEGVEDYEMMDPDKAEQETNNSDAAEDYEAMDESKEATEDIPAEDYEVMADPPAPPEEDQSAAEKTQEDNYEVPEQEQENYEEPQALAQTEEEEPSYEVTDSSPVIPDFQAPEPIEESNYEGIDPIVLGEGPEPECTNSSSIPGRNRTSTLQLESLEKPIKPEDIVGKIMDGFLSKDRTVGKHRLGFGGRWQKRYVVVRDYAMYYYKSKTDKEQRGTILLPGYSVAQCKNKDKEFELTVGSGRTFKFMAESKDDTLKWITAIKKAANATLSDRQSKVLDALREKDSSCDDDSLHYEGVDNAKAADSSVEPEDEVYDDIGGATEETEDTYEIPGMTPPPSRPAQVETTPCEYEISTEQVPSQPPPIEEQQYEVTEEPLPPPPPRPSKQQQQQQQQQQEEEPVEEVKDAPIQEDEYEVAAEPPPVPEPQPSPLPPRPPRPGKPEPDVEVEAPEQPPRPGAKPAVPAHPSKKPPVPIPQETAKEEPKSSDEPIIDYTNVYMALWNCRADDEHELHFNRGDLIYIYEKPHKEWWIGSLFKPQGHKVGLLPKQYVMEAYDL